MQAVYCSHIDLAASRRSLALETVGVRCEVRSHFFRQSIHSTFPRLLECIPLLLSLTTVHLSRLLVSLSCNRFWSHHYIRLHPLFQTQCLIATATIVHVEAATLATLDADRELLQNFHYFKTNFIVSQSVSATTHVEMIERSRRRRGTYFTNLGLSVYCNVELVEIRFVGIVGKAVR